MLLYSCRLKELLRTKLVECGWRDKLRSHCKGVKSFINRELISYKMLIFCTVQSTIGNLVFSLLQQSCLKAMDEKTFVLMSVAWPDNDKTLYKRNTWLPLAICDVQEVNILTARGPSYWLQFTTKFSMFLSGLNWMRKIGNSCHPVKKHFGLLINNWYVTHLNHFA